MQLAYNMACIKWAHACTQRDGRPKQAERARLPARAPLGPGRAALQRGLAVADTVHGALAHDRGPAQRSRAAL